MLAWSWEDTITTIDGIELENFGQGDDVVVFDRRNNSFTDVMGADGTMLVSKQTDKSGTVTFRFLQESDSNKLLNTLLNVSENAAFVPIAVNFKNTVTNQVISAPQCYIEKQATRNYGVNSNDVTWVLVTERLDFV